MTAAIDPNALALPELYRHFAATGLVRRLLELARDEDLGIAPEESRGRRGAGYVGDITTAACVGPSQSASANLVARADGVIAGLAALPDLVSIFAPSCRATMYATDGDHVRAGNAGALLAVIEGPLDEILELERTMLNVVGRLSGIATRTAKFCEAIRGTRAGLFDTRKTTPGLRVLEKYAVRCGGGFCHRIGLYDAVLIKDNHLAGVGPAELPAFVQRAAERARELARAPLQFIEVEVDTLEQFEALLTLPAGVIDIVLLDNMPPALMKQASAQRHAVAPTLRLEASGGVNLETIRAIAESGVDRISVGGLTHSAVSLDVALDVVKTSRG